MMGKVFVFLADGFDVIEENRGIDILAIQLAGDVQVLACTSSGRAGNTDGIAGTDYRTRGGQHP